MIKHEQRRKVAFGNWGAAAATFRIAAISAGC
jgi:hypothetical protein